MMAVPGMAKFNVCVVVCECRIGLQCLKCVLEGARG